MAFVAAYLFSPKNLLVNSDLNSWSINFRDEPAVLLATLTPNCTSQ